MRVNPHALGIAIAAGVRFSTPVSAILASLTPDATITVSDNVTGVALSDPVVYCMTFTGMDASAGGVVLEMGGSGFGVYVGFDVGGDFVVRSGGASVRYDTDCWYSEFNGNVTGDGNLVVQFYLADHPRVWWNDVELTPLATGGTDTPTFIHGGGSGSYMQQPGTGTSAVGMEYATLTYTSASDAKRYENTDIADYL